MLRRAARWVVLLGSSLSSLACAHAETVVHLSAPTEAAWEVHDADGAHLCSLPCTVELEEREAVRVARADGRTHFVLQQENLGAGSFSGSVRVRREQTPGTIAANVVAAALSGAGSALVEAGDDGHVAAGILLSGVGAAARAASDAARPQREELWVERTSTP
jgi:hypothetical protein